MNVLWTTLRRAFGAALSAALATIVLVSGCTVEPSEEPGPMGPTLVPVRGKVTMDGKPFPGAIVIFLPVFSDTGRHCVAETKADGSFDLATMYQPGAAPGEYRVSVSYMVGAGGKVVDLEAHSAIIKPEEFNTGREKVPKRYSDPSQTDLRAIVPRSGATLQFDLTGGLLDGETLPESKPGDATAQAESGAMLRIPADARTKSETAK